MSKQQEHDMQNKYMTKVVPGENLYLLTHPKSSQSDAEIEDLFAEDTLNHLINGRRFTRNDQSHFDLKEYYGKKEFSEYIFNNYKTVNFDGFVGLLDALVNIVDDYQ